MAKVLITGAGDGIGLEVAARSRKSLKRLEPDSSSSYLSRKENLKVGETKGPANGQSGTG